MKYIAGRNTSVRNFMVSVGDVSMSGSNQRTVYTSDGDRNLVPVDAIAVMVSGNDRFVKHYPVRVRTEHVPP